MVGLLVAASYSESSSIKCRGHVVPASPLSCAFAFAWIPTLKNSARLDPIDTERVQRYRTDRVRSKDLGQLGIDAICLLGCGQRRRGGKGEGRGGRMSGDTDFPDHVPAAARQMRQSVFECGSGRCQPAVYILSVEVRPVILELHG